MWLLKRSDGPLVHTLSPSSPITLLQMFIFGSNGLFAMMMSPLKRKEQTQLYFSQLGVYSNTVNVLITPFHPRCTFVDNYSFSDLWNNGMAQFWLWGKYEKCELFKHIPTCVPISLPHTKPLTETHLCMEQRWRLMRSEKTISWLTMVGSMEGPEHWNHKKKKVFVFNGV